MPAGAMTASFKLTSPVLVSGLVGAGETVAIDVQITDRNIMSMLERRQWIPTQVFHAITGESYEVVLEYKDVIGNSFTSARLRHSGRVRIILLMHGANELPITSLYSRTTS